MPALVSITDHDDINAPLLLRTVPSARHIPVSVEWTVPFCESAFHIGVHNLPSATGAEWMDRLRAFTAISVAERAPALLRDILAELHEIPQVLIVFNHPIWDLYRVGRARHDVLVNEFLAVFGQYIHALELNGLRDWKENREAATLAGKWNQLVISGGDRHGVEPNANVNLTRATSFTEFVHEIRRERQSHILYMPQYAEPWKHRILQSTLDAIRDYPHFPEGSRRWDQRVYHLDANGVMPSPVRALDLGQPPRACLYQWHLGRRSAHGSCTALRDPPPRLGRLRQDARRSCQVGRVMLLTTPLRIPGSVFRAL